MVRGLILVIALGAALGACRNPMVPADASDAYAKGWGHGCDTGYTEAGRETHQFAARKDNARYDAEAGYAEGWDEGYAFCYEEEQRSPWMGGPGAPVI